jgi:cephalosporin-C deacetylase-like acetyl esterase
MDFLCSLPQWDGVNAAASGGSQGGALAIVTAGLDPRVKFLSAFYPALCDMTGYLYGRAGGWPNYFAAGKVETLPVPVETAVRTTAYYDVANFTRTLAVPGFYSYGYCDNTCPPTSVTAAVNAVRAPKTVVTTPASAHWRFPETNRHSIEWMKGQVR